METAVPCWAKSIALLPTRPQGRETGQSTSNHRCTWTSSFAAGRSCTQIYLFFPLKTFILFICITITFKAHSSPAVLKTLTLFPTKLYWLVSRVPKLLWKGGSSQKLKQVLVKSNLSGKMGPTIQIKGPHLHPQKVLWTLGGSCLHLKMRYCFVPRKLRAEKEARSGSGIWHLLEKTPLRPVSEAGNRK